MNTTPIAFRGKEIRADERGLYSLNEVLRVAMETDPAMPRMLPSDFSRTPAARTALQLARSSAPPDQVVVASAQKAGTSAVRTIAVAYARWLDPHYGVEIDKQADPVGTAVAAVGFEVPQELGGSEVYAIRDQSGGYWSGVSTDVPAVLAEIRRHSPSAEVISRRRARIRKVTAE